MAKAIWNGAVIAEAATFEEVEGNVYFAPGDVKPEHLRPSETHTICSWKGTASYYDVVVGDAVNKDAAWFYPTPKDAAANIKDHVAFWKGVTVQKLSDMGLLDIFSGKKAAVVQKSDDDLFDDAFQRKLDYLAVVSKKVFAGRMRAERRTKKSGSGIEFVDHREYHQGDDMRSLDWNIYQRFGTLLIRLYEEEEDLAIYLIVDTSTSMGFGNGEKLRQAKKLAAALAYVGLANLDRVSVVAASDHLESTMQPARGKERIFKVLNFLRPLKADGVTDLGDAMKTFVAQNKRRGLAVLLSDLYDPAGFERGINALRFHKFEPLVIHLVDKTEARPTLLGDVRLYDCETGEEREVTVTPKLLETYAAAHTDYLNEIDRFCANKQVGYYPADIAMPFDEIVLRLFRRGGFLR